MIGISTATCFCRLYNEDTLPLFDEWGVHAAEVFLTSFSEYSPSFAQTLKARMGNIRVHSIHVLNTQFEPQLYAEHPRVRADALSWLDLALKSANILGATHYTFHGIIRFKRTFRENLVFAAKRTAELVSYCAERGVTLAYENVEWALMNRPGVFSVLKKECPTLQAVLDTKQARLSGYDYTDYLDEMAGSLAHVHVSDVDETGRMCLPGKGVFDFDALFSRLREIGFRGPVFIENYSGDYKEMGELKASFDFLSEKAEKYR